MYISDDIVEEVRSRNDIVDVISSYVKLEKKGGSYFGLCPFHNEKSGSFSVSRSKQMFYCFGCQEGGNVFSFLMKYEGLSFTETVKSLADRAGVDIPDFEMNSEEKKRQDLKKTLYEINTIAAKYFHSFLESEQGAKGLEYFDKRELDKQTRTNFGLGMSGMKSDGLYRYLKGLGYNDDILKETGLVTYKDGHVYDYFRNRVMFPIINISNKVIGFGGRVMGEGEPKYLNTKETAVFDKGRNLFGLNFAKNAKTNNIIICEGYMDVIAMHKAGFTQAVASLGTALTPQQVMLIKRFVKDVLICYDSDGPGVKAAVKAINMCREAGLRSKVINMQPYKDADEFIKAMGCDAFRERIENAENSFMFEVRKISEGYNLKDPDENMAFFAEVAKKIITFKEEIERNNYIEAVAGAYRIDKGQLARLVAKYAYSGANTENDTGSYRKPVVRDKDDGIKKAQRMLLTWICEDPNIYRLIKPHISVEDFTVDTYQKVAAKIFAQIESNSFSPARILNDFESEEEQNLVVAILNTNVIDEEAGQKDREKALNEAVVMIKRNSLDNKSRNATDITVLQKVIEEQRELTKLHISLTQRKQ